MTLERGHLLADDSLTGAAWCQAHSDMMDAWLRNLLRQATPDTTRVALVAVGGYGRSELCPSSDLDVMLLHHRRADVKQVADAVWYPIWDRGVHLGHSVCSVREALSLADGDLETATALLSARHVAGDEELTEQLATRARSQWRKRLRVRLAEVASSVQLRHESAGEVAFHQEPDLKEGRGGLRDAHALGWADIAQPILLPYDTESLTSAYSVILDARVELHRRTGRASNVLALQEQEGVAAALGDKGPDELMTRIAVAARTIAWTSDDTWRRVQSTLTGPPLRIAHRSRSVAPGVLLRDGEVGLEDDTSPGEDPVVLLRVASYAARHGCTIERHSLERLAANAVPLPDPWPAEARSLLVELLLAGRAAIPVIEALDQRGLWVAVIPEWLPVRARPQHNPYHRYTVDRHLLETAAEAASLASTVDRPDLLVVAALLHDIGKGRPGDHTEVGVLLARDISTRMGYGADEVGTLTALVEQHLLLPDLATRRDLDDPATIRRVATTVGSIERLRLLAALTEADSVATGASAWSPWKAQLVGLLVERAAQSLDGHELTNVEVDPWPTRAHLARLETPGQVIEGQGDLLTVMTADRPGMFSRVAGVLALHGLDVLRASAYSSDQGRALAEFHVSKSVPGGIRWDRVTADLERVLDGRLALHARLSERAYTYERNRSPSPRTAKADVSFDNEASASATVVDVRAADRMGVLYRITRAFSELDLDIRSARIQTLGPQVVDSFYLRSNQGAKITEPANLAEIERAILHSIAE